MCVKPNHATYGRVCFSPKAVTKDGVVGKSGNDDEFWLFRVSEAMYYLNSTCWHIYEAAL